MKKFFSLLLLLSFKLASAQELYPHNEPASSVPKHVIGLRIFDESYHEFGTQRNMTAAKVLFGLTSKISLSATATVSNHHSNKLPTNLVSHTHSGNQTIYQTGNIQRGVNYPYRFNGFYFYAKYRFLTNDEQNKHLRLAAYGEFSTVKAAHDETEPNLLDDTKGYGGGIIGTYLKKHFSVTLSSGIIVPGKYEETVADFSGGEQHTVIEYGKALKYNLSFGYLVYPKTYRNYNQTNINVYLEFMGKSYETARVFQNDNQITPQTNLLLKGNYLEAHPGLQFVIKSNLRIDLAVGFPVFNKSYTRFYPLYMLGIQRYFFL